MKVSLYVVNRKTLAKSHKVQDYGNTKIALARAGKLLVEFEADQLYLERVMWKEMGIKTKSILIYCPSFDWAFLATNSEMEKEKIGPLPLPRKVQSKDENSE